MGRATIRSTKVFQTTPFYQNQGKSIVHLALWISDVSESLFLLITLKAIFASTRSAKNIQVLLDKQHV